MTLTRLNILLGAAAVCTGAAALLFVWQLSDIQKVEQYAHTLHDTQRLMNSVQQLQGTMQASFSRVVSLPDSLPEVRKQKRDSLIGIMQSKLQQLRSEPLIEGDITRRRDDIALAAENAINVLREVNLDSVYAGSEEQINAIVRASRSFIQKGEAAESIELPAMQVQSQVMLKNARGIGEKTWLQLILLFLALLLGIAAVFFVGRDARSSQV